MVNQHIGNPGLGIFLVLSDLTLGLSIKVKLG